LLKFKNENKRKKINFNVVFKEEDFKAYKHLVEISKKYNMEKFAYKNTSKNT